MPNQLKPGTKRLSYVEDRIVAKALDVLAAAKSTNVSALIREATSRYLESVDKDKSIRKLAIEIDAQLPDDSDERPNADLEQDTLQALAAVMKKLRKK